MSSVSTGAVTATHSAQNIRFIRAVAVPEHRITIPRTEDNSASYCNSRFSNIDGDKEQNLRTAALMFSYTLCFIHEILYLSHANIVTFFTCI